MFGLIMTDIVGIVASVLLIGGFVAFYIKRKNRKDDY